LIKEMPADKMADNMTPERIKLVGDKRLSLSEARAITNLRVRLENTKAPTVGANGRAKIKEALGRAMAPTITKDAPKAAPEETPKVYGSAKGLSKSPWKTAPESPKAAPAKRAVTRRGRRTSKRATTRPLSTADWLSVNQDQMISMISEVVKGRYPLKSDMITTKIRAINKPIPNQNGDRRRLMAVLIEGARPGQRRLDELS
jgi:hypothetical protein